LRDNKRKKRTRKIEKSLVFFSFGKCSQCVREYSFSPSSFLCFDFLESPIAEESNVSFFCLFCLFVRCSLVFLTGEDLHLGVGD